MGADVGLIMQHGYVVRDVEKTARDWAARAGVGPFYVTQRMPLPEYMYRGKNSPIELRLAFGYWGSMQIELVQPLTDAESLYKYALRDAPDKLNHCATLVSDLDGILTRRKLHDRVVHSGNMASGVKFVYLEEYLPGGLHLELIQMPDGGSKGFAAMEAVARTWDGKNPVRDITTLAADAAALAAAKA